MCDRNSSKLIVIIYSTAVAIYAMPLMFELLPVASRKWQASQIEGGGIEDSELGNLQSSSSFSKTGCSTLGPTDGV